MPFAVAAVVTGHRKLMATLSFRATQIAIDGRTNVLVGYESPYALQVHESVGMVMKGKPRPSPRQGFYWDPQGRAQAKFLEQPARTHIRQMALIAALTAIKIRFVQRGFGFGIILRAVGDYLLRVSKPLVPIETGKLQKSGKVESYRR